MSTEMFASEEVISFEGSPVEPSQVDYPESPMRYYENVVYVPHLLPPTLLLEYRPVFYNFQTYEPYLYNRVIQKIFVIFQFVGGPLWGFRKKIFTEIYDLYYSVYTPGASGSQVFYVPFIRPVSYTYFVPYYYRYAVPEVFESSVQNEEDTPYNNYPEISLDDVISDDLDNINSSTNLSDVTSVLSLPRSDSSNSYEHTEFSSSTPESYESLQGFVCTEINENLDSMCHDEHNSAQEYPEACFSEVDADVGFEADASNLSLVFVDDEKQPNDLNFPGDYLHPISFHEDRHVESVVSCPSLLTDAEKSGGLTDSVKVEVSSMKNIKNDRNISPETSVNHEVFYNEKGSIELDCPGDYSHPISFHEDQHVEYDVSRPSLLTDAEKSGDLTDSVKIEASSSKNIEKETSENNTVFHSDMESRVSSASSLGHTERYQDENFFEHSQLLSVKNKNVKTSDSPSSPQMPVCSQETPLQNPGSLPYIDAMVPSPFDDVNSESENDSDGDPAISLQDILASEEYWRLKREEYFQKRRNTQLYRSALEGDIRPRKSLPEAGTLATIFEDLPYPINDPYDDGVELDEESVKDEYFDLPPLDVERSKTTLLPKKKRFRNTRKFFSGLMRCFKPR